MKAILSVLSLVISVQLFAVTKIVWIRVIPDFSYQDLTTSCKSYPSLQPSIYFAAELADGELVRVALNRHLHGGGLSSRIEFKPEELVGIEFHVDRFNRYWLKSLPLVDRHVAWVMERAGDLTCSAPQPLKTVVPNRFSYHFKTDGLGEEVLVSYSENFVFEGVRKDDRPYNGELRLREELVGEGE